MLGTKISKNGAIAWFSKMLWNQFYCCFWKDQENISLFQDWSLFRDEKHQASLLLHSKQDPLQPYPRQMANSFPLNTSNV